MKKCIVSIAVLLSMTVPFYLTGYTEFNRSDDVPSVEMENGISTKPRETNPVKEIPSGVEHKTELDMANGMQNVIIAESVIPYAVPATTKKEAEKLNAKAIENAIIEIEKDQPFYRLYQNDTFDTICFEGTIRATSTIPDPLKNDYDNCLYALFIELDSVLSHANQSHDIACEAIVNVPIMKDKTILQGNRFLPGDKVQCVCAEYDLMPQSVQEIQLSDDIQSYEHQQYYPFEIKKIAAFQKGGNKSFSKRKITVLPLQTLPRDENAAKRRKERIQNEISRIEDELKKHGGSFNSWKEEYKSITEKYKQLSNDHFSGWVNNSFYAVGGNESYYNKTKEFIDTIQPYKEYLEKNNIDLIILNIPHKHDFAARVLTSDDFQENPDWIEHYYECLKNDIEIVDPTPEMWKHRFDYPLFYFYHIPTEGHPFEGCSFCSAKVLSDVLKRYTYPKSQQEIVFTEAHIKNSEPRYFWPEGNASFDPKENVRFKQVLQDNKPIGNLATNTGSPFLFLSNSMFAYPYRSLGASVPGYTGYFLQHIPDWFYQDGIGNAMLRNLVADQQSLSNRKAVIMVGAGASSQWREPFPLFPKYLLDDARCISQERSLDFLSSDIEITDDGSFLFTKDEEGTTFFTRNTEKENANKSFSVNLSIPEFEEKSTCMLRINFGTNSYITVTGKDAEDGSILDQTTISFGKNQHIDFFIPVNNSFRKVSIEFSPYYPSSKFSIRNIELWYY